MSQPFPESPADSRWGIPSWPTWVTEFRPHQIAAITEVVDHFNNGADIVILNAPTGAGKTIIAEAVRRLLKVTSGTYVANTNSLVDQFMRDFGRYAKQLKGRSHYPTLDAPSRFRQGQEWSGTNLSAADCSMRLEELPACGSCDSGEPTDEEKKPKLHCRYCHPWRLCPYRVAKVAALGVKDTKPTNDDKVKYSQPPASVVVTNTAYFLTEANGPGAMSGREFVVIDECDTLESIVMSQVEVFISKERLAELGIAPPKRKTVEATWLPWLEDECLPKVALEKELAEARVSRPEATDKQRKWANTISNLHASLESLKVQMKVGNVVYDGYDKGDVHFKPVRVGHLTKTKLWKHGEKFLLMSATVINPLEFVDSLGIEASGKTWEVVDVPSTFPVENRPIYVRPEANMTFKGKDTEWPKMAAGIQRILSAHPDDRVLIHTVSYAFSTYLYETLNGDGRTILKYTKASEREEALNRFKSSHAAVLLASSMDRGVDLPHDDCRVVIVTKMPYLSLGDKQVSKRMHSPNGQFWYQVQTIRSLVQMTGRHVRSADDVGVTYILDQQFVTNVHRHGRHLLPTWWAESLDWTGAR